jgi:hypothetical protein
MRRARFVGAAIGVAAIAGQATLAWAQNKVGTTTAAFLGIEPSARNAGMGNTGVAMLEGIESVYFNPATIGALRHTSFLFTHGFWYSDISFDYAAAAIPVHRWGTLFASVTALGSGEIDVRTVDQPLGTGERYDASSTAVGLGWGMRFSDRFVAGLQTNYVRERIWHTSQDLFTFSMGTTYQLGWRGLVLGSSLTNMGTTGQYEGRDLAIQYDADPDIYGDNSALPAYQSTDSFPVPVTFMVGLAYPWQTDEQSRVLFMLDALHPSDHAEAVNLGAEWAFRDVLALRAGYQTLFQEDSELGLTLGFGLGGTLSDNRFRFDYAWAGHDHLQETHRMTLVLELE